MLTCEKLSYNGEWVMTSREGSSVTVREKSELSSPEITLSLETDLRQLLIFPAGKDLSENRLGFRTSSRTRRWRYLLSDDSGRTLYRGMVEKMTVVNTSTAMEFTTVYFELTYCGDDSRVRGFSASGTEPDVQTALASLHGVACLHHGSRKDTSTTVS